MNMMDFSQLNTVEIVFTIVVGLLLLFAGYRIKKIAFFIVWFLLGVTLMNHLMPFIKDAVPAIADSDLWRNLLPIAGGLLVALMGFSIEKVCVGGIAFGLTLAITAQYFGTEMQTLLIGGVIGVVLAGAAVMLMKPAIIIATSVAGGYALTMGILALATSLNPEIYYFPFLIGSSAIGSVVQFLTTRRE